MSELNDFMRVRGVYLICHDRVADDVQIPGRGDGAIRPSSRAQYERLRKLLPDADASGRFASGERRCKQTAARLMPNVEWEASEHLEARDFGDWTGRTWTDIRSSDPVRCEQFWNDFARERPPRGESLRDVARRAEMFLGGLTNRDDWTSTLVVTHAEIIRVAICLVLDIQLKQSLKISVDPLSVTHVSHNWMGWQVESVNVTG